MRQPRSAMRHIKQGVLPDWQHATPLPCMGCLQRVQAFPLRRCVTCCHIGSCHRVHGPALPGTFSVCWHYQRTASTQLMHSSWKRAAVCFLGGGESRWLVIAGYFLGLKWVGKSSVDVCRSSWSCCWLRQHMRPVASRRSSPADDECRGDTWVDRDVTAISMVRSCVRWAAAMLQAIVALSYDI